jgi:hypothetical protein
VNDTLHNAISIAIATAGCLFVVWLTEKLDGGDE